MTQINLDVLGMTQEELQERVVERIAEKAFGNYSEEHEGRHHCTLEAAVTAQAQKMVDRAVEELGKNHIIPNVLARLEKMTFQATNEWGERVGKGVTFTQYMAQRAESYLAEAVTSDGKRPDNYNRAAQTRIAWLLEQHFSKSIESALSGAAKIMRESLAQGISEAVKVRLEEMSRTLKVTTTV